MKMKKIGQSFIVIYKIIATIMMMMSFDAISIFLISMQILPMIAIVIICYLDKKMYSNTTRSEEVSHYFINHNEPYFKEPIKYMLCERIITYSSQNNVRK